MAFYENYVSLCNSVNKSPSGVALEIGLSKTAVNGWKHGRSNPTDATLQKVADFFGCTIAELTGEMEQKEKPAPESGNELEILDKIIDNMSREELLDFISKATDMLRNK